MEKWRMLQFQSQMRMVLIVGGTRCQDSLLPCSVAHWSRGIHIHARSGTSLFRCSWPEMNDMIIASCDKKRFNLIKSIKIEPETSILLIEVIQSDQSDVQSSVKCHGRKHSKERGPVSWPVTGGCKVTTASVRWPGPQSPAGPLLARCPRRHDAASSRQIYFHGWDCSQC